MVLHIDNNFLESTIHQTRGRQIEIAKETKLDSGNGLEV
jgi:hypothetical protein